MTTRILLAAFAVLLAAFAFAADVLAQGRLDPRAIAGVYKSRFQNGLVTGETYRSEDILELVPLSPDKVYFRAHIEFYNGHQCSLWGVARVAGPELVYREATKARTFGAAACLLRITRIGKSIRLADDDGSCKAYCGARGSFNNDTFPVASRRPIRYMRRLKASGQFRDALDEFKQSGAASAADRPRQFGPPDL